MAAEVHDAEERALGKETVGKMGVQPSLHASAVLGLSLIPYDSYFQSGIAELIKGSRWLPILYFRNVILLLTFFSTLQPLPQTSEEKQLAPSLLGFIVFAEPLLMAVGDDGSS